MSDENAAVILPEPIAPFAGEVKQRATDSTAGFPVQPTALAGAPNVLLVTLDDVDFGAASTFGGPVDTPVLERVARRGLRYNTFHTTAMCSPTRAALLSGRNHHSVRSPGMDVVRVMVSGARAGGCE